jgi:hypothetical protein
MQHPSYSLRPLALLAALVVGAAADPAAPPPAAPSAARDSLDAAAAGPLWMEMRDVRLHVDASAVMRVVQLRGEAVPVTPGAVVVLDDPRSFAVQVSAGQLALDGDALSALMNEVVFGYRGAPIRSLRIRIGDSTLVQSGVLHKGVDLPFRMVTTVALTADGRIRVHPTSMQLLGVDGKRLMRALGLHLKNLLDVRGARGVAVDGDDLLLDPLQMMPPPAVRGAVASVRVEHGLMQLDFARTSADSVFGTAVRPDTGVRNFVYFRGGRLRFGRLEMRDTDLLITDANAADPFDLYLAHYAEQLSAGYSRTMPNAALRVVMPDWRAIARGDSVPSPPIAGR